VIYDPTTGTPFPNNVILTNRINAGAQNLMKYLIAPQFQQRRSAGFQSTGPFWGFRSHRAPGSCASITISQTRTEPSLRLAWDHQDWGAIH
jgi:hypothetical protein